MNPEITVEVAAPFVGRVMMADALKPWSETAPIAAQGGNLDYKVRMNIPQTEINPASFKKK